MADVIAVGAEYTNNTSGTAHSIPFPTNTQNQMLLTLFSMNDGVYTISPVTGWTIDYYSHSGGTYRLALMWKFSSGGEAGPLGLTTSVASSASGRMYAIDAVDLTTPFDGVTPVTLNSTVSNAFIAFGGITPSATANPLILGVGFGHQSTTATTFVAPTGYTLEGSSANVGVGNRGHGFISKPGAASTAETPGNLDTSGKVLVSQYGITLVLRSTPADTTPPAAPTGLVFVGEVATGD